ncbi:MAG: DNA-directed RNA polymerase subunit delta [Bacilli bacterium]|nr:DNA-directed RNA polymerase subunit delta [Bacilli bacterium]
MATNKSMIDIAYDAMQEKKTITFSVLWNTIAKKLNLTDEEKEKKVAAFYTQLSLDGRFVALGNNKWSLRDRLPYDKIHVDLSDIYNDMEEESEDEEDEEAEGGEAQEKKENAANEEAA